MLMDELAHKLSRTSNNEIHHRRLCGRNDGGRSYPITADDNVGLYAFLFVCFPRAQCPHSSSSSAPASLIIASDH
jgi:hypothetical protein